MPILKYDDGNIDQAIDCANDSVYGLGASVWCGDTTKASQIAAELQAGSGKV